MVGALWLAALPAPGASGVRQKRGYDTRCRGRAFLPGDRRHPAPDGAVGPAVATPGRSQRPTRRRRAPKHLRDYVSGEGVVGDD